MDLKLTWSSPFPPPWGNPAATVDRSKAYYVEVGYMDVEDPSVACFANGTIAGIFQTCQHENAFNLAHHTKSALMAAPSPSDFSRIVGEITTGGSYKISGGFYISMFSINTGHCVADGKVPGNVGKTLPEIVGTIPELHNRLQTAASTGHGRWLVHPWPGSPASVRDRVGQLISVLVDRFSFVLKVDGRSGSSHAEAQGYFILSGFEDPEHHLLTSTFYPGPFCAANSRTGCSVTTAQNLAFDTLDALDGNASDPAAVFTWINAETVFPKVYHNIHSWQGFLQKPLGFYVFGYNASDALLVAQGAIPVAAPPVVPGRTIYDIQRSLNVVSHPRLREVFNGLSFIAQGGWLTYQWSNARVEGASAPRKRTFTLPWRPPGTAGPWEYYIGVGYDDVHPEDIGKPCLATEFATCGEEHAFNLAHVVQTDVLAVSRGPVIVDGKTLTTLRAVLHEVTTNPFYRLSTGFYAFVFDYEGSCVAHGADRQSVGKTLPQMMRSRRMTEGGSAELHQKFKDAAERGGDWVTYPWRNSPGNVS